MNQAMGHPLNGYANVAMTRTPQRALAALQETQTGRIRYPVDTVIQVNELWRKQNTEPFAMRAEHAPARGFAGAQPRPRMAMDDSQETANRIVGLRKPIQHETCFTG